MAGAPSGKTTGRDKAEKKLGDQVQFADMLRLYAEIHKEMRDSL
jgi:hypothetical protein